MEFALLGHSSDRTFAHLLHQVAKASANYKCILIDELGSLLGGGSEICDVASELKSLIAGAGALYYRLPTVQNLQVQIQLKSDAEAIISGIYLALNDLPDIKIISAPGKNSSNACKILHGIEISRLAVKQGIRIPCSLFSNNRKSILKFLVRIPEVIIKGGSGSKSECSKFGLDDLDLIPLDSPNFPPLFLQERVRGPDIRVHVVGFRETIAEMTITGDIDYRFSSKKISESIVLPTKISEFCIDLCRAQGLELAGIDFKLREDGCWYLLEINGMPDFSGYDIRSNFKISKALIALMTGVEGQREHEPEH